MLNNGVKFRHLQCFLAVAQQRSLQKAAVALSITQPAVSKTLKELEGLLQVRLFERGRKKATLTPEAETFFRYAATSVSAMEQGVESMTRVRNHARSVISIGAPPTLAPCFLPTVLQIFNERVGDIQVNLITGKNAELLVLLAVRPDHPLLKTAPADASQIRHYPAILPSKGTFIRHLADTFAVEQGIGSPAKSIETLSVSFEEHIRTKATPSGWFHGVRSQTTCVPGS